MDKGANKHSANLRSEPVSYVCEMVLYNPQNKNPGAYNLQYIAYLDDRHMKKTDIKIT